MRLLRGLASGRRRWLIPALVVELLLMLALGYAFFVEPFWIQLTRHTLAVRVSSPLRVAHLSDLHTRGFGAREQRLVALIQSLRPDLIVVTGDSLEPGYRDLARPLFEKLKAPLGVWVVRSAGERVADAADERRFFAEVGARLLDNRGAAAREDVWLVGWEGSAAEHEDALSGAPVASFKIALSHDPESLVARVGMFDLGLAGKTHGGQIGLPFLDRLWLGPADRRYLEGWYVTSGTHLYVNRGIGTSRIPARFLRPPEVALIELRPK